MTSTDLRTSTLAAARRVVVKLGSQLLTKQTDDGLGLDTAFIRRMARQIVALRERGYDVTLVCSGAVAAGCGELQYADRPTDVAELQAVAAVGQRRLMTAWHSSFNRHKLKVGQVLLTRGDFDDRRRFLNIRNCINHLHRLGAIAVLNENDTVAVEELRFGDNDLLAAMVCNTLRADALVLLTVVEGMLDSQGRVIDLVDDLPGAIGQARQTAATRSRWGSGGIVSKLDAARRVVEAGEVAVIASGRQRNVLPRVLGGEAIGTVFAPGRRKLDARRRWIGLTARPAGTVTIDDGAAEALTGRGKSLLASGIVNLTGRFEAGEVLLVRDQQGKEVARGLSNYTHAEVRKIMGKRSGEFEAALGRPAYDEVIHRDNLVVMGG